MPTERAKSKLQAVAHAPAVDKVPESCPVCFGSGMEIVPGKGARVCSCQRNENHSSTLDKAKLPRRYAGCHFNSYSASDPSQVKALRLATQFTMEYPAVERRHLVHCIDELGDISSKRGAPTKGARSDWSFFAY